MVEELAEDILESTTDIEILPDDDPEEKEEMSDIKEIGEVVTTEPESKEEEKVVPDITEVPVPTTVADNKAPVTDYDDYEPHPDGWIKDSEELVEHHKMLEEHHNTMEVLDDVILMEIVKKGDSTEDTPNTTRSKLTVVITDDSSTEGNKFEKSTEAESAKVEPEISEDVKEAVEEQLEIGENKYIAVADKAVQESTEKLDLKFTTKEELDTIVKDEIEKMGSDTKEEVATVTEKDIQKSETAAEILAELKPIIEEELDKLEIVKESTELAPAETVSEGVTGSPIEETVDVVDTDYDAPLPDTRVEEVETVELSGDIPQEIVQEQQDQPDVLADNVIIEENSEAEQETQTLAVEPAASEESDIDTESKATVDLAVAVATPEVIKVISDSDYGVQEGETKEKVTAEEVVTTVAKTIETTETQTEQVTVPQVSEAEQQDTVDQEEVATPSEKPQVETTVEELLEFTTKEELDSIVEEEIEKHLEETTTTTTTTTAATEATTTTTEATTTEATTTTTTTTSTTVTAPKPKPPSPPEGNCKDFGSNLYCGYLRPGSRICRSNNGYRYCRKTCGRCKYYPLILIKLAVGQTLEQFDVYMSSGVIAKLRKQRGLD